jgi:ribosomal protein S21
MINIQVKKTGTENNTNLIRRFTKRVQESGVLRKVRENRYSGRQESKYVVKKRKLKSITRKDAMEVLAKLGKLPERPVKGKGRGR